MSDIIRVSGLSLHGYHGVFDEEKRAGQLFIVDLVLECDGLLAGNTDDLRHTIDYAEVVSAVAKIVTGDSVDLIETLAYRIANRVLSLDLVTAVEVTVHKPDAPVGYPVSDVSFSTRLGEKSEA